MRFESSVISYGSQVSRVYQNRTCAFESSVISYGSQVDALAKGNDASLRVVLSHMVVKFINPCSHLLYEFESSVISYGSQVLNRL